MLSVPSNENKLAFSTVCISTCSQTVKPLKKFINSIILIQAYLGYYVASTLRSSTPGPIHAGLQIEGVLAYFTHLKHQKRIGDEGTSNMFKKIKNNFFFFSL
jgi:hypothetical protein